MEEENSSSKLKYTKNNEERHTYQFSTKVVHNGRHPDSSTGAIVPGIHLSTTFKQRSPGQPTSTYEYSRSGNPSRDSFELAVASLENASHGIAFASGSATTATILHLLPKNSHIIMINDVYGGTYRFFTTIAKPLGYELSILDLSHPTLNEVIELIQNSIQPNTKMLWIESPTNPTLRISQLQPILQHMKKLLPDCLLVVDNTFLTPFYQRPLDLGADLVVHSVTKYLNGHCDVLMGIACCRDLQLAGRLRTLQNSIGAIPSPFDCWLASRGLQTLALRMKQHSENALYVAQFLSSPTCMAYVSKVLYPGLTSHLGHGILTQQQKQQHSTSETIGYGGMLSFSLQSTDIQLVKAFASSCHLFLLAESLGGVESLIEIPAIMTHAAVPKEEREKLGISDSLIRLSIGIESKEDLVADLLQAFQTVFER